MVHLDQRDPKAAKPAQGTVLPAGKPGVLTHREGKWLLRLGDLTALTVPAIYATLLRHPERPIAFSVSEIATILFGILFWSVMSMAADLYSLARASSFAKTHRASVAAALLVLGIRPLYAPRNISGASLPDIRFAIYAVLGVIAWRFLFAFLAKLSPFTKRIVAVGAGISGTLIAEELYARQRRGARDYTLVGFVDDDADKVETIQEGFPVMGTTADLLDLIERHNIDTLCLCVNSTKVGSDAFHALVHARERGVRILSMPVLYERLTEKIAVEHTGDNWGVVFPVEYQKATAMHDMFARAFDISCSLVGLVIVGAALPVLLVVNRFGNRGRLFYSQTRVGRGGKNFRIYKFRSMVENAEAAGAQWAQENDPRITKVGNLLRKTRLDELPQFWNVLKGEMSVIGPRPERPEFVTLLEDSIPFFRARNAVKPGLTGWAQVKYRYGASEEDALVKLQYDLYYIKHRSPAIDIRIIAKSVKVILTGAGR